MSASHQDFSSNNNANDESQSKSVSLLKLWLLQAIDDYLWADDRAKDDAKKSAEARERAEEYREKLTGEYADYSDVRLLNAVTLDIAIAGSLNESDYFTKQFKHIVTKFDEQNPPTSMLDALLAIFRKHILNDLDNENNKNYLNTLELLISEGGVEKAIFEKILEDIAANTAVLESDLVKDLRKEFCELLGITPKHIEAVVRDYPPIQPPQIVVDGLGVGAAHVASYQQRSEARRKSATHFLIAVALGINPAKYIVSGQKINGEIVEPGNMPLLDFKKTSELKFEFIRKNLAVPDLSKSTYSLGQIRSGIVKTQGLKEDNNNDSVVTTREIPFSKTKNAILDVIELYVLCPHADQSESASKRAEEYINEIKSFAGNDFDLLNKITNDITAGVLKDSEKLSLRLGHAISVAPATGNTAQDIFAAKIREYILIPHQSQSDSATLRALRYLNEVICATKLNNEYLATKVLNDISQIVEPIGNSVELRKKLFEGLREFYKLTDEHVSEYLKKYKDEKKTEIDQVEAEREIFVLKVTKRLDNAVGLDQMVKNACIKLLLTTYHNDITQVEYDYIHQFVSQGEKLSQNRFIALLDLTKQVISSSALRRKVLGEHLKDVIYHGSRYLERSDQAVDRVSAVIFEYLSKPHSSQTESASQRGFAYLQQFRKEHDRENIEEVVLELLQDITYRHDIKNSETLSRMLKEFVSTEASRSIALLKNSPAFLDKIKIAIFEYLSNKNLDKDEMIQAWTYLAKLKDRFTQKGVTHESILFEVIKDVTVAHSIKDNKDLSDALKDCIAVEAEAMITTRQPVAVVLGNIALYLTDKNHKPSEAGQLRALAYKDQLLKSVAKISEKLEGMDLHKEIRKKVLISVWSDVQDPKSDLGDSKKLREYLSSAVEEICGTYTQDVKEKLNKNNCKYGVSIADCKKIWIEHSIFRGDTEVAKQVKQTLNDAKHRREAESMFSQRVSINLCKHHKWYELSVFNPKSNRAVESSTAKNESPSLLTNKRNSND